MVKMRRADKALTEQTDIDSVLHRGDVCHLAIHDTPYPYVVPMNFGYRRRGDTLTLYFHSAKKGRKISLIEKEPKVAFVIDTDHALVTGDAACRWSMSYASVMGVGTISHVEDTDAKRRALQTIMEHYSDSAEWELPDRALAAVAILALEVEELTGKRSPPLDAFHRSQ